MITPKGFLNCYELDEWLESLSNDELAEVASSEYEQVRGILDNDAFDDDYIKETYYPEEL